MLIRFAPEPIELIEETESENEWLCLSLNRVARIQRRITEEVLDEAITCVINSYTGSVYRGCGDPDRALRLTRRNGTFMSRICSRNTFVNSLTELESYWPLGLKVKLKTLSVATGTPSRIAGL
jgi:hypothetical protein